MSRTGLKWSDQAPVVKTWMFPSLRPDVHCEKVVKNPPLKAIPGSHRPRRVKKSKNAISQENGISMSSFFDMFNLTY